MTEQEPVKLNVDWPSYILYGQGVQLKFSVFNGLVYCTVFKDKAKAFSRAISDDVLNLIESTLIKMDSAGPGTTNVIRVSKYDKDTKKRSSDYVIKLIKNESFVYEIEVMDAGGGFRVPISCSQNVTVGSDPFSDKDKSAVGVRGFIHWLQRDVVLGKVMSRAPRTFRGGNRPTPSKSTESSASSWDDNAAY